MVKKKFLDNAAAEFLRLKDNFLTYISGWVDSHFYQLRWLSLVSKTSIIYIKADNPVALPNMPCILARKVIKHYYQLDY